MKALRSHEIRQTFLTFFQEKGHNVCASDGLIPANDPTLLFTTAGMVQFKPLWAGAPLAFARAASVQKCLRAGGKSSDLENVGRTLRHHTFFEMLGNFSFGDYFKDEAIAWAWEFVVDVLGIPQSQLWVSVFREDDEAFDIWTKFIAKDRIVRLDEGDNFWGPAGPTGACGPCSEMYIDLGPDKGCGQESCAVGCDCERYLEFWNIVFPQYFQNEDGSRKTLPRRGIDTGMGLERLATILQDVDSNYATDLFVPLVEAIVQRGQGRISYPNDFRHQVSIHVMADHIRALTMTMSENIIPSNDGRGYVIRRLLRRASRHAYMLGFKEPVLCELVPVVVDVMKTQYPELVESMSHVQGVIRAEEKNFKNTLVAGMQVLDNLLDDLRKKEQTLVAGKDIFYLYDTLGFPLDLIRDIVDDEQFLFDEKGFNALMAQQQEMARAGWKGNEHALAQEVFKTLEHTLKPCDFGGYADTTLQSSIVALVRDHQSVDRVQAKERVMMILARTPFYAESGGQVGDTGVISSAEGRMRVQDTTRFGEKLIIHHGIVDSGHFSIEDIVQGQVDDERRDLLAAHHTVTHILQAVLQEHIDANIKQAGSYVGPDRLRFDFSHYKALTFRQWQLIEEHVNAHILADDEVLAEYLSLREAKAVGAMALFGEKYGDVVRMVSVGHFSKELCGGTHVSRTGCIGPFRILSEKSVSAGIRRIEAIAGRPTLQLMQKERDILNQVARKLSAPIEEIPERIDRLMGSLKEKDKDIQGYTQRSIHVCAETLAKDTKEISGIRVVAARVDQISIDNLRCVMDAVKVILGSGIVVLGTQIEEKVVLIVGCTKDRVKEGWHAGKIISPLADIVGGRGGGKAELAQAGGPLVSKLDEAIEAVVGALKK